MIDDECSEKVVKILVGNKIDLLEQRKFDNFTGHLIARDLKMDRYVETSALRNIQVSQTIDDLLI